MAPLSLIPEEGFGYDAESQEHAKPFKWFVTLMMPRKSGESKAPLTFQEKTFSSQKEIDFAEMQDVAQADAPLSHRRPTELQHAQTELRVMRSLEQASELIRTNVEAEVGEELARKTFADLGLYIEAIKVMKLPADQAQAKVLQLGVVPYESETLQSALPISQALLPIYFPRGTQKSLD